MAAVDPPEPAGPYAATILGSTEVSPRPQTIGGRMITLESRCRLPSALRPPLVPWSARRVRRARRDAWRFP